MLEEPKKEPKIVCEHREHENSESIQVYIDHKFIGQAVCEYGSGRRYLATFGLAHYSRGFSESHPILAHTFNKQKVMKEIKRIIELQETYNRVKTLRRQSIQVSDDIFSFTALENFNKNYSYWDYIFNIGQILGNLEIEIEQQFRAASGRKE